MDSWPLILMQYILVHHSISFYSVGTLWLLKKTFSLVLNFQQTEMTSWADKDDKHSPSFLYSWGPYIYCMLKEKEMTVGCFSVYTDGLLGTCFMPHLNPLTHFCDWLLSIHPLYVILLFDFYIAIHPTQHCLHETVFKLHSCNLTLTLSPWTAIQN